MLFSILKILFFAALVALVGYLVYYIWEAPGGVTIEAGGREYFFPLLVAAGLAILGVLALLVVLWVLGLLLAVLRFILGDETAVTRYWSNRSHQKGLAALSEGWLALEAGDAKRALDRAERAERKLQQPELTRLLIAKSAEAAGETQRAKRYYKAMAEERGTAFVGVQGLLNRSLAEGEKERALKLAETAHALQPREPRTLETLYTLQSQKFDWSGARKTLSQQKKVGMIEPPIARRRDAMLALAQAEDAEEVGEHDRARDLAVEAAKLDPNNPEAAAAAARHLARSGKTDKAERILIDAWGQNPSPEIAAAFAAIEPDETPEARRKRFEKLLSANETDPESVFLRAELALITRDWRAARKAIADLREPEPTARACAVMAAIARGEGAPEAEVRAWLARALDAPRDPNHERDIARTAMLPLLMEEAPLAPSADPGPPPGPSGEATARMGTPPPAEVRDDARKSTPEPARTETRQAQPATPAPAQASDAKAPDGAAQARPASAANGEAAARPSPASPQAKAPERPLGDPPLARA